MPRLRGTGIGAGMALGTAAIVKVQGGVAVAPARITALMAQRRLSETPEVVIVAADYATAVAVGASLSWAKVVGIAAERAAPDAAVPSIPAVVGLTGLMEAATDDTLILVDATRGVALIDPDPIYLAQYTAEHDRVAPKNRIYLDDTHLPALTLDGRTISVVAQTDGGGIEAALASGADALYHALPLTFDADVLRRHLSSVIGTVAGKPLLVPYNPSLSLRPIVEAATASDITLCVCASLDSAAATGDTIAEVAAEIERAQAECGENDVLSGPVRIAALVEVAAPTDWPSAESMSVAIEGAAAAGATRILYQGHGSGDSLSPLSRLCSIAGANLMPVTCVVDAALLPDYISENDGSEIGRALGALIGAGASGFLVSPELTQRTKAAIRTVSASGCREELLAVLTEG